MATTASAPRAKSGYEIDVEDVEYLRDGDTPLLARLYKPRGTGPFPLMIDLHGGAWCTGDRMNDTVICEALAKSGVVVAALDFRMPPQAGYPGSIADIHYAIRWLEARATPSSRSALTRSAASAFPAADIRACSSPCGPTIRAMGRASSTGKATSMRSVAMLRQLLARHRSAWRAITMRRSLKPQAGHIPKPSIACCLCI